MDEVVVGDSITAEKDGKSDPFKWREEFKKRRIPTMREFKLCAAAFVGWGALVSVGVSGLTISNLLVTFLSALLVIVGLPGIIGCVRRMGIPMWGSIVRGPLNCFCPHCGYHISSEIRWRCGYCKEQNSTAYTFSFLDHCEHCEAIPKSYVCHHCGGLIFLDEATARQTKGDSHAARQWIEPTPEDAKPITQSRQEELEEIQFKTTRARMNADLAHAEKAWKAVQSQNKEEKRPKGSKLEQRFEEHWNRNMEVHSIADRNLKKAEEDYADDPRMLEQAQIEIREWVAVELGRVE